MTNKEIYKKTIGFSYRKFFFDILSLVILIGGAALGFFVADKSDNGLIGLIIGIIVAIIIAVVISRYIAYSLQAAQIAMMTKSVTENTLPDDVIKSGKAVVKERFLTVAAYFAVTSVIKGVFSEIGNGISKIGRAVGGDTGEGVGSAVASAVQVMVNYMCDCCLEWESNSCQ